MIPTSSPLYSRGAETAVIRSPVWGSSPCQEAISCFSRTRSMSPVPGMVPERVRPLEE